jgi:hypothetical protein
MVLKFVGNTLEDSGWQPHVGGGPAGLHIREKSR